MLSWWRRLLRRAKAPKRAAVRHRNPFLRRPIIEALEDRTLLSTFKWVGAGSDTNWTTAANWSLVSGTGAYPGAAGDIAQFLGTLSKTTAVVDQPVTVGEIDFNSPSSMTISGANALTLQGAAGGAVIDVASANTGTQVISAPLMSSALGASVAGGTLRLANTGAGAGANSITGTFTVKAGGTLEGLMASGTGSNALGAAAITLAGGTLRPIPVLADAVPGAAAGVQGKYYNLAFTPSAMAQIDFT